MSCEDLSNASEELKKACACVEASKTFIKALNLSEQRNTEWKIQKDEYDKNWGEYQTALAGWETKYAAEKKRLQEEEKIWNNCVDWNTASSGNKDSWCQDDTGFADHIGGTGGGCTPGFGKGRCRRTETQVNTALDSWIAGTPEISLGFIKLPGVPGNPKPLPPTGGTNGTVTPCGSPCQPPSANILCCSQVIQDIQAGKGVNVNAIQTCNQELINAATSIPTTEATATSPSTVTTSPATPNPEPPFIAYEENQTRQEEIRRKRRSSDDTIPIAVWIVIGVVLLLLLIVFMRILI